MTRVAPQMTVVLRERRPLQRGARAQTCARDAATLQPLVACASPRRHRRPAELCLAPLDAPLIMDCRAPRAGARGHGPRTRHPRLAALNACRRCRADRVPSLLEHSRRGLARPPKHPARPLVHHLSRSERPARLDAPDVSPRAGIRDRARLHLGFAAGRRVSERLT
jgi:integrase/recombinase XerD